MEDKSNIKLSKEQKRHIKREYYIGELRKELKERYDKLVKRTAIKDRKKTEAKLGRKLDKYDERKIKRIRRNADRKVRRNLVIGSVLAAASITLGGSYLGHNMLAAGNNKAIEAEAENDQTSELITKEFENQGKAFREGLREFEDKLKEIRKSVQEEVEPLSTREEAIMYYKSIFAEVYNQDNIEKISAEDVKSIIRSEYEGKNIKTYYVDVAKNGDEILRTCTLDYARNNGFPTILEVYRKPLLRAEIYTNNDGIKIEQATEYNGRGFTVYPRYGEQEEEYTDNTLSKVAKIMYKGIALADDVQSSEKKLELIDAVVEYRSNQIQNERNQNAETAKTTIQKNKEERE